MAERGGQLRNTNASKGKPWSDAVRKHAVQNGCYAKAAKKLWDLALTGDMAALKEAADRSDGKAVQSVEAKVDTNIQLDIINYAEVSKE